MEKSHPFLENQNIINISNVYQTEVNLNSHKIKTRTYLVTWDAPCDSNTTSISSANILGLISRNASKSNVIQENVTQDPYNEVEVYTSLTPDE